MQIINDGKKALDKWQEAYQVTWAKIEHSAMDHRWQFEKNALSRRTSHMSVVCTNLHEIVQVLDQFYKCLGPELREVTDSQGIDEPLQEVEGLKTHVQNFKFMFDEVQKPH